MLGSIVECGGRRHVHSLRKWMLPTNCGIYGQMSSLVYAKNRNTYMLKLMYIFSVFTNLVNDLSIQASAPYFGRVYFAGYQHSREALAHGCWFSRAWPQLLNLDDHDHEITSTPKHYKMAKTLFAHQCIIRQGEHCRKVAAFYVNFANIHNLLGLAILTFLVNQKKLDPQIQDHDKCYTMAKLHVFVAILNVLDINHTGAILFVHFISCHSEHEGTSVCSLSNLRKHLN